MTLNALSPKLESIWFDDDNRNKSPKKKSRNAFKRLIPKSNILQLFDLQEKQKGNYSEINVSTPFAFRHVAHIDDYDAFGLDKSFRSNNLSMMTSSLISPPNQISKREFDDIDNYTSRNQGYPELSIGLDALDVSPIAPSPAQDRDATLDPKRASLEDSVSSSILPTSTSVNTTNNNNTTNATNLPFQAFSSFRTTPTAAPVDDEYSRRRHTHSRSISTSSSNLLRSASTSNSTFTRSTSISTLNTVISNDAALVAAQKNFTGKRHISISNSLNSLNANSLYQYNYQPSQERDTPSPVSYHEKRLSGVDEFIAQPIKEEDEEEIVEHSTEIQEKLEEVQEELEQSEIEGNQDVYTSAKLQVQEPSPLIPSAQKEIARQFIETVDSSSASSHSRDATDNENDASSVTTSEGARQLLASPINFVPVEKTDLVLEDDIYVEEIKDCVEGQQDQEQEHEQQEQDENVEVESSDLANASVSSPCTPPHIRKVSSYGSPAHSRNSSFTFELLKTPSFEKSELFCWTPMSTQLKQSFSMNENDDSIDLSSFSDMTGDDLEAALTTFKAASHIRSSRLSFSNSSSGLDRLAMGAQLRELNCTMSKLVLPEMDDE